MAKKPALDSNSPITVGVDDGFACTDVVVMEGPKVVKEIVISSRARPGANGVTSITGELDGPFPCYETEGVQFTVGELPDAESARFDEYPFSPMNRAIVHHALRVAGLAGRDVQIATGLPLSRFYLGDKPNAEVIKRKDESIRKAVASMDGTPVANIVKHQVFAEGLGAYIDYLLDDEGNERADDDETVGVIDIGGRTTDCAVVLPGRRIDHARCGSADVGVLNVVELVRASLQKELNVDAPGALVEKALRTKTMKLWGKPTDISGIVDAAIKQVTDSAMREVSRRFGAGFDLDRILLVGGGALVLSEVAKHFRQASIPEKPEFANARGFGKYMYQASLA